MKLGTCRGHFLAKPRPTEFLGAVKSVDSHEQERIACEIEQEATNELLQMGHFGCPCHLSGSFLSSSSMWTLQVVPHIDPIPCDLVERICSQGISLEFSRIWLVDPMKHPMKSPWKPPWKPHENPIFPWFFRWFSHGLKYHPREPQCAKLNKPPM